MRVRSIAVPLLVALLAAAGYVGTLRNGFVLDDRHAILGDPTLGDLRNLPLYFRTNYWGTSLIARKEPSIEGYSYRPISTSSFSLDHALWGLEPFGYHLTNLLCHALASLATYAFLRGVLGAGPLAALAAALFAVHPVHSEAVMMAAYRPELLSALFGLLALTAYTACLPAQLLSPAGPGAAPAAGSVRTAVVFCFALLLLELALFSKESAIMLPVLLTGLEAAALLRRNPDATRPSARTLAAAAFPGIVRLGLVAVAVALYLAARFRVLHHAGTGFDLFASLGIGPARQAATMVGVFGEYLRLLVWPHPLCADYPENGNAWANLRSFAEAPILLSAAAVTSALAGALLALRRRPDLGGAGLWFFITLFPVSHVVFPLMVIKSERALYLPSVGGCVCLAAALLALRGADATTARARAALVAVPALLLAGVLLTAARTPEWSDQYAFARRLVEQQPASCRSHQWLAGELMRRGRHEEAIEAYGRSMDLQPGRWVPRLLRGIARQAIGEHEAALQDFHAALALYAHAPVYLHRAKSLLLLGRADEAWTECRLARIELPEDPATAREYALFCLRRERPEEANRPLAEYVTGVTGANPPAASAVALELARGWLEVERPSESLAALERLAPGASEHAAGAKVRGEALLALGRAREALEAFNAALASAPDDPAALLGRARARLAVGTEPAEALADLERALPRAADPIGTSQDLVIALLRLRRTDEAAARLRGLAAAGVPPRADVVRELRRRN